MFKNLFLSVVFIITVLVPIQPVSAFYDVSPESSYFTAVEYLAHEGIISTSNNDFYLERGITRAEIAKIALIASGKNITRAEDIPFSDLNNLDSSTQWLNIIYSAKKYGLIDGYADGTFQPWKQVSKIEALKIILEALYVDIPSVDFDLYKDVNNEDWWAKYVSFVEVNNYLDGVAGEYFGIQELFPRKYMAQLLYRALNNSSISLGTIYENSYLGYSLEHHVDLNIVENYTDEVTLLEFPDQFSKIAIMTIPKEEQDQSTIDNIINGFLSGVSIANQLKMNTEIHNIYQRGSYGKAVEFSIVESNNLESYGLLTVLDNENNFYLFIGLVQSEEQLQQVYSIRNSLELIPLENFPDLEKPFLWKIKGEKDSYLFGTVHLGSDRLKAFPEFMDQALEDSDSLYTEVLMDGSFEKEFESVSQLRGNIKLEDILSDSVYKDLEIIFGSQIDQIEKTKPWIIAVMLSNISSQDSNENTSLDEYLSEIATAQGKEKKALETVKEHLKPFDSLSYEEQALYLEQVLFQIKTAESSSIFEYNKNSDIVKAYVEGNEYILSDGISSDKNASNSLDEKLFQSLIIDRNNQMAKVIDEAIQKNSSSSYFFAAGVGHFIGEQNIVDLLREKGYEVERVQK